MHAFHQATDPTVDDDDIHGFKLKGLWFNEVSTRLFRLDDPATGAADWTDITGLISPGPTVVDDRVLLFDGTGGIKTKQGPATGAQLTTLIDGSDADGLHSHAAMGDVSGPAGATDDRMVAFDGTNGKLIKQGTKTATQVGSHLDNVTEHRTIDDGVASITGLWSSSKIDSELSAILSGVDVKAGVDTSTHDLGNIALTGEQTLNGLLTSASRVLVTEQTAPADNGIYVTAAGAWSRAADADTDAEVTNGNITHVLDSGSTKFTYKYLLVTPDPITVGSTGQVWEEHRDIDFGTTGGTATEGNDSRVPAQDENDALVGTSGTPSTANKYVTDADLRNSDARTPTAHTHDHGALTGKGDDDHTQYLLADGSRALSGSMAVAALATIDGRDLSVDGGKLDGIEAGAKDDQAAAEVPFTPDGDIAATDVQAAIVEVRDDTDTKLAAVGADLWASLNANRAVFPASNPGRAGSRNAHPILKFDAAVAQSVVFHEVMSRDYSAGNLTVDIDWVAASATTGGVTWGVEVERSAPGGTDIDADSFATQQTGTSTTNATSGVVTRTSIVLTQAQADSIAAGDAFRLRLQRVVGDGGDDMTGDAQVLRVIGRQ